MLFVFMLFREPSVVLLPQVSHNLVISWFLTNIILLSAVRRFAWLFWCLTPIRFGWRWAITYVLQIFISCKLRLLLHEYFFCALIMGLLWNSLWIWLRSLALVWAYHFRQWVTTSWLHSWKARRWSNWIGAWISIYFFLTPTRYRSRIWVIQSLCFCQRL